MREPLHLVMMIHSDLSMYSVPSSNTSSPAPAVSTYEATATFKPTDKSTTSNSNVNLHYNEAPELLDLDSHSLTDYYHTRSLPVNNSRETYEAIPSTVDTFDYEDYTPNPAAVLGPQWGTVFSSSSATSSPYQSGSPYVSTPEPDSRQNFEVASTSSGQPTKPRRKGGRKPKNNPLPPHLEERRRLRRIRNKEAAQKCREKRLEHEEELQTEIINLEQKEAQTKQYIETLKQYKEQCEYSLSSHRPHCSKVSQRKSVGLSFSFSRSCSKELRRSSSSNEGMQSPPIII